MALEKVAKCESVSCSVVSNSLRPHAVAFVEVILQAILEW